MELLIIIFMIGGGVALAISVLAAIAVAGGKPAVESDSPLPGRDRIAASVLFQLLLLGGTTAEEANRRLRREAGLAAPVTPGVDVSSWGETFARAASLSQREWLLRTAVQLVAERTGPVPLRQYSALLDLSFSLGFQTSALARLREEYGFEFVDHAQNSRPPAGQPLGERESRERSGAELLRVLEIEGATAMSRQRITTAYRRLAARHHPDRFHDEPETVRAAAAAKFIEISRAYEILLTLYRD